MEEPILRIEHLSHRYNIQWAVRDISFEIPKRGIYGLLGSNGAGKSTTMNIISGVIKQTEGSVFIKGIDARKRPVDAKRHIGFLPQKPPLYGDLTVEEFLYYSARLRWVPANMLKSAVEDVLVRCGIAHFRKRLIKNLSGGYQQRVGIAQAIIHKPEIVIFDEPTNGLDPNQIMEVRHLIKDIAQERTIILSTHILTEVQATCDNIMMIEQGKLVFMGTVDEFDNYIAPNTIYLRMGNPPTVEELAKVENVQGVEDLGDRKFRVRFENAQEAMDSIVKQSVVHDWHLSEIRVEKTSLDKIFSELSKKIQ
ncbi:ABC transporter ATP-binding protein [Odoribacter sp. AF15-53]|uniref:ABC transporter ATP-binding protein n=1 Tax=Odoribacter sp. AF15-53 TaxID=2292236 RepID=UPI000E4AF5A7|nr:ABC transporter ATP-binding protein [Odoribacter sp. AF15-53]RHR76449.1 ABC transporter ATP-binding protein [Odoribacter sp. AF15-53]